MMSEAQKNQAAKAADVNPLASALQSAIGEQLDQLADQVAGKIAEGMEQSFATRRRSPVVDGL